MKSTDLNTTTCTANGAPTPKNPNTLPGDPMLPTGSNMRTTKVVELDPNLKAPIVNIDVSHVIPYATDLAQNAADRRAVRRLIERRRSEDIDSWQVSSTSYDSLGRVVSESAKGLLDMACELIGAIREEGMEASIYDTDTGCVEPLRTPSDIAWDQDCASIDCLVIANDADEVDRAIKQDMLVREIAQGDRILIIPRPCLSSCRIATVLSALSDSVAIGLDTRDIELYMDDVTADEFFACGSRSADIEANESETTADEMTTDEMIADETATAWTRRMPKAKSDHRGRLAGSTIADAIAALLPRRALASRAMCALLIITATMGAAFPVSVL